MSDQATLQHRIAALESELAELKKQLYSHSNTIATNNTKQVYTYDSAGVSIDNGDALVQNIKPLAKSTYRIGIPDKNQIIGVY